MLRKLILGLGLFFLVTSTSYAAGNTSSYVDLELGGFGLRTISNDEEMLDGKIGEGFSAGLWVGLFGGLRIGGDFDYTIINVDEKLDPSGTIKVKLDKIVEKQASAGLTFSFLNFESNALYLKATVGLWTDVDMKLKDNDVGVDEDELAPTIKQPNLYGGIGWFFSNVKGKVLKNIGTRIEVGYQTQRIEGDDEDPDIDLADIRVKGTLVYSIR